MSNRQKSLSLTTMASIISHLKGATGGRVGNISDALSCMETPDYRWMKEGLGIYIVADTVRKGTLNDIRLLHSLGYDLHAKCTVDGGGGNALHIAAQHNRQAHALLLVEMGLKADQKFWIRGYSALDTALANGNVRLFNKLIQRTGKPDEEARKRFLEAALERGNLVVIPRIKNRDKLKLSAVQKILQDYGPFSQQELDQALESAARGALPDTFDFLVKAGANPSSRVVLQTRPSFRGLSSAAVLLFSTTDPRALGTLIQRYSENTQALFPSLTKGRENDVDLDALVEYLEENRPAYRQYCLHEAIAPAIAFARAKTMDSDLPPPTDEGANHHKAPSKRMRL